MSNDELRVEVTSVDIRAAADAWTEAAMSIAPAERIRMLSDDMGRLMQTQAQQLIDDAHRQAAKIWDERRRPQP